MLDGFFGDSKKRGDLQPLSVFFHGRWPWPWPNCVGDTWDPYLGSLPADVSGRLEPVAQWPWLALAGPMAMAISGENNEKTYGMVYGYDSNQWDNNRDSPLNMFFFF